MDTIRKPYLPPPIETLNIELGFAGSLDTRLEPLVWDSEETLGAHE